MPGADATPRTSVNTSKADASEAIPFLGRVPTLADDRQGGLPHQQPVGVGPYAEEKLPGVPTELAPGDR